MNFLLDKKAKNILDAKSAPFIFYKSSNNVNAQIQNNLWGRESESFRDERTLDQANPILQEQKIKNYIILVGQVHRVTPIKTFQKC